MQAPAFPSNEVERLAALRQLDILDSAQEEAYDRLVRYVAETCGTEISVISLIDANRQWFKAKCGLDACETGRDISFCGHAILQEGLFEIPDAQDDERFADNPLVLGPPHIRFYAGAPLVDRHGHAFGTVCAIHSRPMRLDAHQRAALMHVASQVVLLFEMRKAQRELSVYRRELERYKEESEEEKQLLVSLMTRMMRPDRLDASAMEYWMQSADRMGGDLVAAARSPHGRYYVMLADATGHGLPAAINLLPINRVFYTMVRKNLPVGLIAERMNASVRDQSPPGRFVVALILCFDQANRLLEVWNGGIPMALFLNEAGQIVRRFTSENLPLGLDEGGAPPHTVFHRWEGEGQFFACSDGLTDAESPEGKPLGEAAVEMALAAAPASRRFNQLRRVVHEHMVGQAPHDDLTALMVDTRKLLPAVAAAEHGETGK